MFLALTRLTVLCVMLIHGVWGCGLHHVHRACADCDSATSDSAASASVLFSGAIQAEAVMVACCSSRGCRGTETAQTVTTAEHSSPEPQSQQQQQKPKQHSDELPSEGPTCCERDECSFLVGEVRLEVHNGGWSPCPVLLNQDLDAAMTCGLVKASRQRSNHHQLAETESLRRCALLQTWLI